MSSLFLQVQPDKKWSNGPAVTDFKTCRFDGLLFLSCQKNDLDISIHF
jgi:hypothetical protein